MKQPNLQDNKCLSCGAEFDTLKELHTHYATVYHKPAAAPQDDSPEDARNFIRETNGTGTDSCRDCNRRHPDLCVWHDARAESLNSLYIKRSEVREVIEKATYKQSVLGDTFTRIDYDTLMKELGL